MRKTFISPIGEGIVGGKLLEFPPLLQQRKFLRILFLKKKVNLLKQNSYALKTKG